MKGRTLKVGECRDVLLPWMRMYLFMVLNVGEGYEGENEWMKVDADGNEGRYMERMVGGEG
jgi:hypothetical protein